MAKKVSLRVLEDERRPAKAKPLARKKPSIDAARDRLGGRITSEDVPPAGLALGLVVGVGGGRGEERVVPGVVIYASRTEVHVLLDGVRLRRVQPDSVRPYSGDVSLALSKIAGDAKLFARLAEGESVRYAGDDGHLVTAKLVEKCRWGALVAREDGAVIAVGFRKLWPSSAHGDA
ncbi:MAG: hypothetical protein U0270_02730 [Labilithrix sp.]